MRILVFPAWQQNPYINILYLLLAGRGEHIIRTTTFPNFTREVTQLGAGDVIHIHWTSQILQPGLSERELEQRIDTTDTLLAQAKSRGVSVLWTIHNKYSHETASISSEEKLAAILIARADRVIQISSGTREAVSDAYTIPEGKLVTLRHSSYLGIYPDNVLPSEAKNALDIDPTIPTIGLVGQLRPYKGVDTLIAASGLVASRLNTPLNLVLAGTLKGADPDQVAAMVPPGVNAITHFEYIADEYLQMWYKTLDIAVFPYRRILNSGSVFLSTTFGIPSILPDEPSLEAEFSQEPWVSFYSTSDNIPTEELLAQQIVKTLRSDLEAKSLAARTYAREHTPYQMSKAYTDLVDEITGESMRNA